MTAAQPGMSHGSTEAVEPAARKGRVERVIETLATGLGDGVTFLAETGVLFVVFGAIWLAFGAALIWSQGSLDAAWQTIRAWPIVVQVAAWILFLPVMIGLWAWETTWPLVVRLLVVGGIAGWNLLIFLPKVLQPR